MVYQVIEVFERVREGGKNKACYCSVRYFGLPTFVKERILLFFEFAEYKSSNDRIIKVRSNCIGIHLFKKFGLDFDREANTVVMEKKV